MFMCIYVFMFVSNFTFVNIFFLNTIVFVLFSLWFLELLNIIHYYFTEWADDTSVYFNLLCLIRLFPTELYHAHKSGLSNCFHLQAPTPHFFPTTYCWQLLVMRLILLATNRNRHFLFGCAIKIFIFLDRFRSADTTRVYCPNDCGRSYTGKNGPCNLKRHLRHECGVEPKFQCNVCSKRFAQKCNLKTHSLVVHKLLM